MRTTHLDLSPAPDQTVRQEFDGPPKEVATELLCNPKAKMSNRERKVWQHARETKYISTRAPKAFSEKMEWKVKQAGGLQLVTWLERTRRNIRKLEAEFKQREADKARNRLHQNRHHCGHYFPHRVGD